MNTETRKQIEERVQLQEAIIEARGRGGTAALARLQATYRNSGFPVDRVHPSATVTLRDSSTRHNGHSVETAAWRSYPAAPELGSLVSGRRLVFDAMDVLRMQPYGDGTEGGCVMVGQHLENGDTFVMSLGRWRSDNLFNSVTLRLDDMIEEAEHFRSARWSAIGDLHTHSWKGSGNDGVVRCSDGDRRSWQVCADRTGRDWIGLILSPSSSSGRDCGDNWMRARMTAWLATPGGREVRPLPCVYSWKE